MNFVENECCELKSILLWNEFQIACAIAPFVKIVGTTDVEIKLNSKELSFFVSKKGCDDMLNIIKEKLDLSPDLKKKIDWAKNYTSTSITLEKGHLIRLEPSNLYGWFLQVQNKFILLNA